MSNESAYARAGVDIEAGEHAVDLMKAHVAATRRPEVLGGLGGFAGFFDAAALGTATRCWPPRLMGLEPR